MSGHLSASARAKELRDERREAAGVFGCGHPLSEENIRVKKPSPSYPWEKKICRTCDNQWVRLGSIKRRARLRMDREIVFRRAFGNDVGT